MALTREKEQFLQWKNLLRVTSTATSSNFSSYHQSKVTKCRSCNHKSRAWKTLRFQNSFSYFVKASTWAEHKIFSMENLGETQNKQKIQLNTFCHIVQCWKEIVRMFERQWHRLCFVILVVCVFDGAIRCIMRSGMAFRRSFASLVLPIYTHSFQFCQGSRDDNIEKKRTTDPRGK